MFENFEWVNEIPESFNQWLYNNHPELINTIGLFLKDYENLTPIVKDNKIFYVDSQNKPIFYYYQDKKNGFCYFKYYNFWEVFEKEYGMKYTEIQEVMKVWLELTYNLVGLTPLKIGFLFI